MAAPLRFGLIGSGYMGRAHAIALHSAAAAFGADYAVGCVTLAALGFAAGTADWRTLVADPGIDVVDICTPNHLHAEMALAAIAAGKHVYCEKPLALDIKESSAIVEAARRAGVVNVLGFNYICNPMLQVAREMIENVEHATIGPLRVLGTPLKLSQTPGGIRTAPPTLGQHTDSVLMRDLGMASGHVDALRMKGIV